MTAGRAGYIAGLRLLADALDAHPELPLPSTNAITFHFLSDSADPRAEMAAAARAIPCTWAKVVLDGEKWSYFELHGKLAGLRVELTAFRDAVCTRVVTGAEERELVEVVTPAVTRKVVKLVEVVEWQCGSLLAPAPDVLMPAGAST